MHITRRMTGPVAIAYDIAGSGPLVVFLHGIGGNRSNCEGQIAYFAARFCAVAWDARGYGASEDPPQTLKFSDYTDDLVRLLDHLGGQRCHLVGLSMGG
jgi:3-oxoadipate enol-lactonase